MLDKKLTDSEIKKALEDEIHLAEYVDSDYCSNVKLEIIKSALDLITHQQAKIERLNKTNENLLCKLCGKVHRESKVIEKLIKTEAYKEFAERLKDIFEHAFQFEYGYLLSKDVIYLKLEKCLKDMEGEN